MAVEKAVATHQSRRIFSALLSIVLLLAMIVAAVLLVRFLGDPEYLPIRTIQIKNEYRNLDKQEIQQTLIKALDGHGFFDVDLKAVRDAVSRSPWVARATVRRVWPDSLVVEVQEQVPVAYWGKNGLINAQGEVFYPTRKPARKLPLSLTGPEHKAQAVMEFFIRQQPAFKRHGLSIRAISLSRRGEWKLDLKNDVEVVVGSEQVDDRIQRLLGVYSALHKNARRPQRVDLRYDQGFAVRWRQEETS